MILELYTNWRVNYCLFTSWMDDRVSYVNRHNKICLFKESWYKYTYKGLRSGQVRNKTVGLLYFSYSDKLFLLQGMARNITIFQKAFLIKYFIKKHVIQVNMHTWCWEACVKFSYSEREREHANSTFPFYHWKDTGKFS